MSFTVILDIIAALTGIAAFSAGISVYLLKRPPKPGGTPSPNGCVPVVGGFAGILLAVCIALVVTSIVSAQKTMPMGSVSATSTGAISPSPCGANAPCPSTTPTFTLTPTLGTGTPGSPTPTATATKTRVPFPTLIVSTNAAQSTDGQAHGSGNPYIIPLDAQYNNVTIQGGAYASSVAHCSGGNGTIRFTAVGTVQIDGTITVDGQGFCGGQSLQGAGGGKQGDSYTGSATKSSAANFGGGGGGDTADSGGGGGGYGAAGQQSENDPGVFGGNAYGDPTMATVYLGSGGGSSGAQSGGVGGAGGNGGGSISIHAGAIVVNGSISANGSPGASMLQPSPTNYRGGGGGSGGSILLYANTVSLGNNLVEALGGTGGYGIRDGGARIDGGGGGVGRIRVAYTQSVSGTTYPAANVAHV